MSGVPHQLGDSHNFGRRVLERDGRIFKPRTLLWEWLVLSAQSPLRRLLDAESANRPEMGESAFGFLPDLDFENYESRTGGAVEALQLAPLTSESAPALAPQSARVGYRAMPPLLDVDRRRSLARIVGRSLALWSWLGVSDLHWENLVVGMDTRGRMIFAPLDVEMILADLSLPTETKLIPDADPEYAALCRHACGVRRILPYLGKPVDAPDLLEMLGAYQGTLRFLDRNAQAIAGVFQELPELAGTPIRVCLRATEEYVRAPSRPLWPPLLEAETIQLARGDIPYFFRLYGRPGIHYYGNESLTDIKTIPLDGDMPQLDPIHSLARGLRSPTRKKLREEGLLTVLGAFDHAGLKGHHANDELEVTFAARTIVCRPRRGVELESRRDMRAFVGSVYLPCRCGEVCSVFVPTTTVCEATSAIR
jgi:hypothetical protein